MSESATEVNVGSLKDDLGHVTGVPFLKSIGQRFGKHEISTLSTSFAYFWTFAIPPLLILATMIGVLIDKATDVEIVSRLRDLIDERASEEFKPLLLKLLDQAVVKVGSGAASVGVLLTVVLALWSASSAIGILMLGFNRAYEVSETRSWLHKKGLALGLTLALVAMVNVAFFLLVFGERLGTKIADWLGMGSVFTTLWQLARWPVAIFGMMFVLSLLYWAGPNVQRPFRLLTAGAILATVLWLVLVAGFGIYLSFSNPGSAYGVAGSVIVLLIFLNLTGIVFFMGAEIDAAVSDANGGAAPPLADG
jgi:membrane protein